MEALAAEEDAVASPIRAAMPPRPATVNAAPAPAMAAVRPAMGGDAIRAAMRAALGRSMGGGLTIASAPAPAPRAPAQAESAADIACGSTGAAAEAANAEEDEEDDPEGDNVRAYITATRKDKSATAAANKAARQKASAALPEALLADDAAVAQALAALPDKHVAARDELMEVYEREEPLWALKLRSGSSLLFHGFGSKRALVEAFVSRACVDGTVLEVDGFEAGLTVRHVLRAATAVAREHAAVAVDAPPPPTTAVSTLSNGELVSAIKAAQHAPQLPPSAEGPPRLYLVVHSIDGPGLRSAESQGLLAEVAACSHVHLIASADHLNAALLWDREVSHGFGLPMVSGSPKMFDHRECV